MRISELTALSLEDVEDDGDVTFLKIKRGKGAKFRRVPVSSRLRRELVRRRQSSPAIRPPPNRHVISLDYST